MIKNRIISALYMMILSSCISYAQTSDSSDNVYKKLLEAVKNKQNNQTLKVLSEKNTFPKASKSPKLAEVSLDELDDYFTVKSYTIESDAEEKGVEKLDYVKGTLTIVIERNQDMMRYKPSQIKSASFYGQMSTLWCNIFYGDCEAVIRKMVKMEPGSNDIISLGFKGIDPYNEFNSEEENINYRQNAFDALTKKGCLDQILFSIVIASEDE